MEKEERKRKKEKIKKGAFKMTPLDQSFKNLLLKRIPELRREELDRYDNVIALSQELRMLTSVVPQDEEKVNNKERDIIDKEENVVEKDLERALNHSYKILTPYWKRYKKLHAIWLARQRFAQNRGNILQIVSSFDKFTEFTTNYFKYLVVNLINNIALFFTPKYKSLNKD